MDKNLDILRESIDKMVRETISEENRINTIIESVVSNNLRLITEKKKGEKDKTKRNKKHNVIQWLQKPEVNCAEIRRKLEGEPQSQEEEDSKRSYFMKKVNQSNGKDFTDSEINSLYALKSSLGY